MKPLNLVINAFGPFAGRQEVDFSTLDDLGLYLVAGDTGSGKTSIFDALVFALYGTVPGVRGNDLAGIRSHFADPGTTTKVTLEFVIGGDRWRVERMPTQERLKKKGEGTTKINVKATLEHWDGGAWDEVASGKNPVDKRVEELLGLDDKQFSQVVLLPQGGFQKVLLAKKEDREGLLRTLFASLGYKKAADYLKEEATRLRSEASTARAVREKAEASVAVQWADALQGLADLGEETDLVFTEWPVVLDENDEGSAMHDISGRMGHLEGAKNSIEKVLGLAEKKSETAEKAHRKLTTEAEKFTQKVELELKLAEFAASEENAKLDQKRHKEGVKAAPVVEALDELKLATQGLVSAQNANQTQEQTLVAVGLASKEVPKETKVAQGLSLTWARRQAECQTAAENLEAANDLRQNHEDLLGEVASGLEEAEDLEQGLKEAAAESKDLQKDLAAAEDARAGLVEMQKASQAAQEKFSDAGALLTAQGKVKKAEVFAVSAAKKLAKAQKSATQCQEQQRKNWAGHLAQEALVNGESCPVCGAEEHPSPAPLADGGADEALAKAESDQQSAATAQGAAQASLHAAQEFLVEAKKKVKTGNRELSEVVVELENSANEAQDLLNEVQELADGYQSLKVEADRAEASKRADEKKQTDVLAEAKNLQSSAKQKDTEATKMQKKVDDAVGPGADPAALTDQAAAIGEALSGLLDTLQAQQVAEGEQRVGQKTVDQALSASPFKNSDGARAAFVPGDKLAELGEALESRSRALALAEGQLAGLKGAPKDCPDIEAATVLLEQAREYVEGLQKAFTTVDERKRSFSQAVDSAKETAAQGAALQKEADLVERVDKTCRGTGAGSNRSLESWVLARFLKEVAVEASVRLRKMSSGQYGFVVRTTDDEGKADPLRMDIDDHYSGTTRQVSSLSGGEQFMASLSLALGLADTVQRRNGGLRIECLFVDEGFGSLDPATLDLAIDTLVGLRDEGRTVGLISHVEGVKGRIDLGLEVKKSDNQGSRIVVPKR